MYLIERRTREEGLEIINYFGPFPTEGRATDYALQFDTNVSMRYKIMPMIVPNCVTVRLNY